MVWRVAPSQMVSVSASVNLPLHHKVQKFSSGTGSPGWSRKKGRKTVVDFQNLALLTVLPMTVKSPHSHFGHACHSFVIVINNRAM